MKKYIFMAVAGMLALSSCSSDDNEQTPQNAPRQMTFTAGFGDGTQTRTTLNTADKSVSFDANDVISIFSENNTNVLFTTTEGGATAEFTGTAVAGDATYYAVYPYNYLYRFSGGIVSGVMIELSQQPDIMNGETWIKSSVISYATATGSDLVFHNACALLKITNNTGPGAEIEISADQSLVGTFDLDMSTGALTVTDGTNSVTTRISPDNATVYLAIAPGTYTNFTAAKSNWDDAGEWYSKTKASVTFEKGKIYDLGTTSSWMKITVNDLVKEDGQSWSDIIANNLGKIQADDNDNVVRVSDGAVLKQKPSWEDNWQPVNIYSYYEPSDYSYKFEDVIQKITVNDLVKEDGQSWSVIIANNPGKIQEEFPYVVRVSDGAKLQRNVVGDNWDDVTIFDSYQPMDTYKFEGDDEGDLSPFDIQGIFVYYVPGESWAQAKENHASENGSWWIVGDAVYRDGGHILYWIEGPIDNQVSSGDIIDPNKYYQWH